MMGDKNKTRQSTMDKFGKTVTFKDLEIQKVNTEIDDLKEQNRKLKQKVEKDAKIWERDKKEMMKRLEQQKELHKLLSDRIERIEARLGDMEKLGKTVEDLSERLEAPLALPTTEAEGDATEAQSGEESQEGARGGRGSTWSLKRALSTRSNRSDTRSGISWASGNSEGFTGREVTRMKKMLYDKERLERACNIVFKGVNGQVCEIEKTQLERMTLKAGQKGL